MAEILVTASELKRQADELNSLNGQFKNQVASLESQEGSLNSMWEGEANQAFHMAFSKDKEQMNNFYNLMTKYIQTLISIAAEYEKAENININTGKTRTY